MTPEQSEYMSLAQAVEYLMSKGKMTKRQAKNHLRKAIKAGDLPVRRRQMGPGRKNLVIVVVKPSDWEEEEIDDV